MCNVASLCTLTHLYYIIKCSHLTGASYVHMADVNTGQLIRTLAEPGVAVGSFRWPSGVACDVDGNFLIADSRANRVQVYAFTISFMVAG